MTINGTNYDYDSITITHLLDKLNLNKQLVFELNGTIIDQSDYDDRLLRSDDVIEIVSFVGGG